MSRISKKKLIKVLKGELEQDQRKRNVGQCQVHKERSDLYHRARQETPDIQILCKRH